MAERAYIISVIPPTTAQLALADLDGLLTLLWEALEAGAADAHLYFEEHGETVNRTLYPGIVRYRAIQILNSAGVEAAEFELASIANNGIEIAHGPYKLRVLKAEDGDVPRAGTSARKRNFYCQGTLFGADWDSTTTNLVLIWDYSGPVITELTLACPLAAESKSAGVQTAWSRPVPHPVERQGTADEKDEAAEDLPITFRASNAAEADEAG